MDKKKDGTPRDAVFFSHHLHRVNLPRRQVLFLYSLFVSFFTKPFIMIVLHFQSTDYHCTCQALLLCPMSGGG